MIYIINNTRLSARLAPKHTFMQDARLQDCKDAKVFNKIFGGLDNLSYHQYPNGFYH